MSIVLKAYTMFFYIVLTPISITSGLWSTGNTHKYHQINVYIYKCEYIGHLGGHLENCTLDRNIAYTRWVSFDIKFTRQGFKNACWHREACRAIQHAFSKPSLVKLISKDSKLVFYLSIYILLNTLQTSDYDVFFYFCVDSASFATSLKKCNVIMTW